MCPVEISSESEEAVKESINREMRVVEARIRRYEERLSGFEKEHGMSTEEFLEKFEAGELGDDEKWFEWDFAREALETLQEKKRTSSRSSSNSRRYPI